jgi:FtsP/CotA-like multicopper oxidase with cupredoxin domain
MPLDRTKLTRRSLLGAAAGAGALAVVTGASGGGDSSEAPTPEELAREYPHGPLHSGARGHVDAAANGFDPDAILTDFDGGTVTTLPGGRTLRTWEVVAREKEIQVAPGVSFLAWTYNGRVPGPTFRATEGDRLRIRFTNATGHPHTMHFHGIHPSNMDGIPGSGPGGLVEPGATFTYEFDATPFGLHLYHCHTFPLATHIHRGLYGAFIIDPKTPRPDAHEMVMVMNGFDTNFDGANEVYAVNTVAFHYMHRPIKVRRDELVRIYLVNVLEFDAINSFHLHANFFHYYPTGTSLTPAELTDTISQVQGQRGILEVRFPYAGRFMFHAHKSEFAELGWVGMFEVT